MSVLEFSNRFTELEALLLSFAVRLTKDQDDAQDLLQETAYKAFKYRKMYQPHTNLRAWLLTIMRNTFINEYRRKKRQQTQNDKTDNNFFINSGDLSVHNQGEGNIVLSEIESIVEALEDWMKIPFMMHYQGYKYEEIAENLDIPIGTVKSRIFFARKRLKKSIQHIYRADNMTAVLN